MAAKKPRTPEEAIKQRRDRLAATGRKPQSAPPRGADRCGVLGLLSLPVS